MNARMIAPPLPIAGAAEDMAAFWMTRAAAADRIGVDPATISRWAAAGIITAYTPIAVKDEKATPMFYGAQVEELARAKALLKPDA